MAEPAGPAGPVPEPPARARGPWRTAFLGLAVAGLVIGVGWALLGSKLLVVRSVVVTGTHLVSPDRVRAAAGIPPKLPMIRVDTHAAARRVEGITQVRSATVTKSWPDRIVITVHERTPALAVPVQSTVPSTTQGAHGGGYDLVDPAGVVVRSVKVRPAGMPVYQTKAAPGSLRGNPAVAAAVTVLHQVPAPVARAVAAIAAPNAQDVTLGLSDGVVIAWGNTSRAREKATELAILMRTHARYYDVSAPETAVTR